MTALSFEELNRRANEVFFFDEGDEIVSVEGKGDYVIIKMQNKDGFVFDYLPDMTGRPQALAYLKGERDDFDD